MRGSSQPQIIRVIDRGYILSLGQVPDLMTKPVAMLPSFKMVLPFPQLSKPVTWEPSLISTYPSPTSSQSPNYVHSISLKFFNLFTSLNSHYYHPARGLPQFLSGLMAKSFLYPRSTQEQVKFKTQKSNHVIPHPSLLD